MHRVPNSSGTVAPQLEAPPGATDCHIHIYDPRFPPPVLKPQDARASEYRLLQKRLGLTRVVVVTPRNYVVDNSITLDAIRQLGRPLARGIAVIRPTISDRGLKALDEGGVRGIRFTLGNPSGDVVTVDMIEPLAKRIAVLGWHIQLHVPPQQLIEHAALLNRLPVPLVFDHMGRPPLPLGINSASHKLVRSLVDKDRAWVKLSGAYLVDEGGPPYAHSFAVAQDFVNAAPQRLVWGSDWPHPGHTAPDDGLLFDLLSSWIPNDATRFNILVRNPETLYGFDAHAVVKADLQPQPPTFSPEVTGH